MKFAIRDDDASFFTRPEELDEAFSQLEGIPITLSVIPSACPTHGAEHPYGDGPFDRAYGLVGDNRELVSHIRDNMARGRYEVIMHGIHHEYRPKDGGWEPEMSFLPYDTIKQELPKMRQYLQEVFGCPIRTFAAPSNTFSPAAFRVLDEEGLDTMCLLSKHRDHPLSAAYLGHYLQRNVRKLLHKPQYTKIQRYKNHRELPTYEFTTADRLWQRYLQLKECDLPLILYVHYWALNRDPEQKQQLARLVQRMMADGAVPAFVSECFEG